MRSFILGVWGSLCIAVPVLADPLSIDGEKIEPVRSTPPAPVKKSSFLEVKGHRFDILIAYCRQKAEDVLRDRPASIKWYDSKVYLTPEGNYQVLCPCAIYHSNEPYLATVSTVIHVTSNQIKTVSRQITWDQPTQTSEDPTPAKSNFAAWAADNRTRNALRAALQDEKRKVDDQIDQIHQEIDADAIRRRNEAVQGTSYWNQYNH